MASAGNGEYRFVIKNSKGDNTVIFAAKAK
jgi:hypothetical protein